MKSGTMSIEILMVTGLALFGISAAIILVLVMFTQLRRGRVSLGGYLMWAGVAVAVAVLLGVPELVAVLSNVLSLQYSPLSLTFVGFLAIYLLTYRVFITAAALERKVTVLAQDIAILNGKLNDLKTNQTQKAG